MIGRSVFGSHVLIVKQLEGCCPEDMKSTFRSAGVAVGVTLVIGAALILIVCAFRAVYRNLQERLITDDSTIALVQPIDTKTPAFKEVYLFITDIRASITIRQSDHYGYYINLQGTAQELFARVKQGSLHIMPRDSWDDPITRPGIVDLLNYWGASLIS